VNLRPGSRAVVDGKTIYFEGLTQLRSDVKSATEALVLVDGHGPYRPAITQFGSGSDPVGTPAIDSGPFDDVYLTIDSIPSSVDGAVGIGVTVQPLVAWLWVGGGILAVGALLAAVPGRRRRPTDPISAPLPPRGKAARVATAPEPIAVQNGHGAAPDRGNGSAMTEDAEAASPAVSPERTGVR